MGLTEMVSDVEPMGPSPAQPQLPGRLAGLSVRRQVLVLAIWPFLEQLLGFCVGFVDTAIAGRLSVEATEAVAVASYVGWLLVLLFGSVGIGAAALVARDRRPPSSIGACRAGTGTDRGAGRGYAAGDTGLSAGLRPAAGC